MASSATQVALQFRLAVAALALLMVLPGSKPTAVSGASPAAALAAPSAVPLADDEPPSINPFGPVRQDRDDAIPGTLELSDGRVLVGNVYMTRDKRLKIEDQQMQRQREVPLSAIKQIECHVEKEWMEKEWRFKEAALNEKVYTGRTYPSRVYSHTITLKSGKKITGPMAEVIYIRPYAEMTEGPRSEESIPEPQRFLLNKRNKGPAGADLKSLVYVTRIKLGQDAVDQSKSGGDKSGKKDPAASGAKEPKPKPTDADTSRDDSEK